MIVICEGSAAFDSINDSIRIVPMFPVPIKPIFNELTNRVRNIPVLKVLGYPGLWLQLLTTKEPADDQVEVAIESFNELLRLEDISEQSEKPSHNVI
ncbi:DUF1385 domain-containing protein [Bacillus paralicheniformis]|uniref:DUF1385 domain-containing protein n=1 Tax=Bacillus paralicheniformis TaxID=1648923 RepID=UPI0021A7B7E4|nr:DUF1385 domain-containing protein [Bacillus paralicheniformis]UWS62591.1 DUF1385 domain-containing protein [Bacillus paralicheniformis]